MSEQEVIPPLSPEQQAENELTAVRVKAFIGGVQAASIAMRGVLARKVDVGIITEATARGIFEAVGVELTEAFGTDG